MSLDSTPEQNSTIAGAMGAVANVPETPPIEDEQHYDEWRAVEAKNSFTIAHAQKPIVLITEKAADSYGRMAKYLTETFPQTPFVFENDAAQKAFMKQAGPYYAYVANNTIGICDIDNDFKASHAPELKASDCIVVMGTPETSIEKALKELNTSNTPVIIHQTPPPIETYIPVAGVNLAQINKIASKYNIPRTELWMQQARNMRPTLA